LHDFNVLLVFIVNRARAGIVAVRTLMSHQLRVTFDVLIYFESSREILYFIHSVVNSDINF